MKAHLQQLNFKNMLRFELLVCAETLMKDPERESFSAINILEDFTAEIYPTFIPKFNILLVTSSLLEGQERIDNIDFYIKNNDNILYQNKISIDFKGKSKANTRIAISSLPIKEPGKLTVTFSYGNEKISFAVNANLRENVTVSQAN
jgi:hypothetical protein